MSKSIEFKGIPSGDYDGFCWDVSPEMFKKITGRKPARYEESYFNKGMYRIYPSEFFNTKKEYTITIKVKE